MNRQEYLIKQLELSKHPEGGYYRQVYKSDECIKEDYLPERFHSSHAMSTAIYFMLTNKEYSAFHIIKQDELWHHYEGGTIEIVIIEQDGTLSKKLLGKNFEKGEEPLVVVPYGVYFSARLLDDESYSLVGCTVSPGFEFDDFYMPTKNELIALYPNHKDIIEELGYEKNE